MINCRDISLAILFVFFFNAPVYADKYDSRKLPTEVVKEEKMNFDNFFELDDKRFFHIDLGSGSVIENQGVVIDKVISNDFQGIIIDGPTEINIKKESSVPLLGLFRVLSENIDETRQNLLVVVTDNVTKESFSSTVFKPKRPMSSPSSSEVDEDDVGDDEAAMEAEISMEIFDVDLRQLLGLPVMVTNYSIFVTIGEVSSNVIQINVVSR